MAGADHPTRSFYDRISGVYDLIADAGEHEARERGLERFAASAGERILEVGCGTGHALVDLARAVGGTGRIDGVDISEGMLGQTRQRVEKAGLKDRVELHHAEVPPLPFDERVFDAAFLSFTLELFPLERIPAVLTEIRRVLRPEGRLGVVAMASVRPDENESLLERGYIWMHRHFPHIVDCQPIEAERLISQSGFELMHEERIELFTMPVAIVVASPQG